MLVEGVAKEDDVFMASLMLVLVVLLGFVLLLQDLLPAMCSAKALGSPVSSLLSNLFEWIQTML
jgi:hypothetical protein